MKAILLPLLAAIAACASTPETADRQASTLFAIAGGLDAASEATFDPQLSETYDAIAVGTRALADLVRAGGIVDEQERVLAYVEEVRSLLREVLPYLDEDEADQLRSVDILLGVLKGLYLPPE
jgi:hypothetical protein